MLVINYIGVTAALFLLVLPFLFSSLGAGSWALGSVLAAFFCVFITSIKRKAILIPWGGLALLLAIILANLLVTCIYYGALPSVRQLLSIAILILLYIASCGVASWLATQRLCALVKCCNATAWFLLAAAFGSKLIGLKALASHKPILYFSEPSHFAIALAPLAVFLCITARRREVLFFLSLLLASSLYFENATLLVLLTICATVSLLRVGIGLPQLFAVLFLVSVAAVPMLLQSEYFGPRISLSDENLSSLVYLRGLESAQDSLIEPPFLGVGFQMMGSRVHQTKTVALLQKLNQESLNSHDGGFLLAKLITEFGLFGAILACAYFFVLSRGLLSVVPAIRSGCLSQANCIYLASCASVILQLLVRGGGYLGPFVCYALLTFQFRPSHPLLATKLIDSVAKK